MASLNNQKQAGAEIATTTEQQLPEPGASHPSDGLLKGEETLGLYLSEIGRNMMAIGAQSALLLSAWKEQVALLRAIDSALAEDRQETKLKHAAGDGPGAKPK